jgi:thiol:disulfide interchange protein
MRRIVLGLALLLSVTLPLRVVEAAPPQARQLLDEASASARRDGRSILLLFHASWCGWCKRMEAFMATPAVRQVLTKYYEIVWLDANERGAASSLENPGARAVLASLGGAGAGLPFFAVIEPGGKVLATSVVPSTGRNTGFPQAGLELQHFANLIKTGAPGITQEELTTLRRVLLAGGK